ncbi:MAG: DUF1559 domain-containing protein [Planctomycetia bacterium]|nr:DUF1559 domain-containing protein [Planctomycetia bacterium]
MQCHRRALSMVDVVVVLAIVGLLLSLALPAMQGDREKERRESCAIRMKNLATAFHIYHDNMNRFPSSAFYGDGQNLGDKKIALKKVVPGEGGTAATRAPYSFVVKLLPYIEQGYLFDQISFKDHNAFDAGNEKVAATAIKVLNCPSFEADQHSTSTDYDKFAAGGPKPALSQYKAVGATTLAVLQNAEATTAADGDGGVLNPYTTRSLNSLRAPTETILLCETREPRYAAWFDGTTAAIPGFDPNVDRGMKATRPALWTDEPKQPFLHAGSFGGTQDMQWGPSSAHPGIVLHAMGGTEVRSIKIDIEPRVYAAMITLRVTDDKALDQPAPETPADDKPAKAPADVPKDEKAPSPTPDRKKSAKHPAHAADDPDAKPAAPKARLWYDASGTHSVKAALVKIDEDNVILRRADTGKEITMPISKLSGADQKYLARAKAKEAAAKSTAAAVKDPDSPTEKESVAVAPDKQEIKPDPPAATRGLKFAVKDLPKGYEKRSEFGKAHQGETIEFTGLVFTFSINETANGKISSAVLCSLVDDKRPFGGLNVDTGSFAYCFFAKGPKDFVAQYRDRALIVHGRVVGFDKGEHDSYAYFQHDAKASIVLGRGISEHPFKTLKVGDEIAVFSPLTVFSGADEKLDLLLGDTYLIDLDSIKTSGR